MDSFDQQYLVFRNIHKMRNIPGIDEVLPERAGAWKHSGLICSYVNNLSEEMVSSDALISDPDRRIKAMGHLLMEYRLLLIDENLMDFSSIQTEAYHLLTENQDILEELRSRISHIMVDEYQDTNYIQEQLVFLLAGDRKNICVVGDDDQGLYRFRGATIRNILEFPQKFPEGACRIIPLVTNYRSNSDIVDFYNKWMATTDGAKFKFEWGRYRYDKTIVPYEKTRLRSPAVIRLASADDKDEWHDEILQFIQELKDAGQLTDYNQIAFLFSSVKHQNVAELASFLEKNHINVYSPRSDMFFQREEIRLILGCIMLLFPQYVQGLENNEYEYLQETPISYYRNCIMLANEYLHRINVLDAKEYRGKRRIDQDTETLFNIYLRLLYDGGITEYEDDSEYAPNGCVSFLTIHQSKGMEFPIVIVDSLANIPRKRSDELLEQIEDRYFKRPAFEPKKDIKFFDFWRLYYTAFSRAQDLLVLTCNYLRCSSGCFAAGGADNYKG